MFCSGWVDYVENVYVWFVGEYVRVWVYYVHLNMFRGWDLVVCCGVGCLVDCGVLYVL